MGTAQVVNRGIMLAGILVLSPFLNPVVHEVFQEKNDPVPPKILRLLKSSSPTQNIRGFVELAEFDGNLSKAVPFIESGLKSNRIGIRNATEYMLKRSDTRLLDDLQPLLESEDFNRYRFGCDMAFAIGEPSAKFVGIVMKKMEIKRDPEKKAAFDMASLHALRGMGPKAEPALEKIVALLDPDPDYSVPLRHQMRRFALQTLIEMGPAAKPAAGRLAELVDQGTVSIRGWAGLALAKTGLNDDIDVVKTLAPRIKAYNTVERERILEGFACLGSAGKSQLPVIKRFMESPQYHTQPYAAYTYYKVSGEAERPVALLTKLAGPDELDTNQQAIELLGRIGPDAASATKLLIDYVNLDEKEITMRELAVIALGRIGPKAKAAVPHLQKLVAQEADWLLRAHAISAIEKLQNNSEKK